MYYLIVNPGINRQCDTNVSVWTEKSYNRFTEGCNRFTDSDRTDLS